eukprot:CAMPEP_0116011296 /NCGR_PEP_ID=MMETSP0321-20121206/4490_1 /TAXON_ID=163516 /ORGANISM="Leptocylindrus danicus var. danicus, Strain B650" /LENGTH=407 /DNA_ID=CAMNT_0003480515 /DNA_START=21 /DNA_END=1244 /DNA_ORIENTATION=-
MEKITSNSTQRTGSLCRTFLKLFAGLATVLLVLTQIFYGLTVITWLKQPQGYIYSYISTNPTSSSWDSSKSAVLGLATKYNLDVYKIFVGSLRATGFDGHIILGISEDLSPDVMEYLAANQVTTHVVEVAEKCTYQGQPSAHVDRDGRIESVKWICAKDYPDYKLTWARFALYKDWLLACPDCTDGVILTDVRDAYFQRDPFRTVKPEHQRPLMVFEEDPRTDTTHWLTDFPIKTCKGKDIGERRMLCSGSTMGSREGILDYIDVMMEEFDEWKTKSECRTNMKGDDQSIHNSLYYENRFRNVIAIPYRTGPINVIGYTASEIFKRVKKEKEEGNVFLKKNDDDKWQHWLPEEYDELIDPKTGLLVNIDGSPSGQIHQHDRFGWIMANWMSNNSNKGWPYNSVSDEQ